MPKPAAPKLVAAEVMLKLTFDDGSNDYRTRWTHPDAKGQWSSASALGKDHREHSGEVAARTALAGWLRSQALILSPDDQVIDASPATHERGSTPQADPGHEPEKRPESPAGDATLWDIPAQPSAAGLEDLL